VRDAAIHADERRCVVILCTPYATAEPQKLLAARCKPRLLDLFCGAGGAARGYQMAGFHVTGVDIKPQPRYAGDRFILGDALEYVAAHGHEYDAIHASPPCQSYSQMSHFTDGQYPRLIAPIREVLISIGRPYVIENVGGAARELNAPIILCGHTFGLKTYRHRYFEVSPWMLAPSHVKHPEVCPRSGRGKSEIYGFISVTGNGGAPNLGMPYLEYVSLAMGIGWMNREEISESIPPAYTRYIGQQLRSFL
jgi:hypothetical protein